MRSTNGASVPAKKQGSANRNMENMNGPNFAPARYPARSNMSERKSEIASEMPAYSSMLETTPMSSLLSARLPP
ncbi:Uncharacterised protein [uncultured archaeon]|nr:Uncharacterised protein [uncultured archaeon]